MKKLVSTSDVQALIDSEILSIRKSGMLDKKVWYVPRIHYILALQNGERCDPYDDPIDYPKELDDVTVENLRKYFTDHPFADAVSVEGGFDARDHGEWEPVHGLEWCVEIKKEEV